jgi:nitrite reductase (NO-forming)
MSLGNPVGNPGRGSGSDTDSRPPSRGFWPMRDLPAAVWLLATVVVVLVHPYLPAPRWLMIHLLVLGAVTHSILVWSRHFADALLHTAPRPGDRRIQSIRLLLLNLGAAVVVAGVLTEVWPVTVVGASAVAVAVVWHGATLAIQLRHALASRFGVTVRYYVAAAALLPAGLLLGTLLARGLGDPTHEQLVIAHVTVNVLGWMGLTVVGTLLTLWPTMLRTRMPPGAEVEARRVLPLLVAAVLVAAGGAVGGALPVVAVGLVGYLGGLGFAARPFVLAFRSRPPASYATWSVLAAVLWLAGLVATLAIGVATTSSWEVAGGRLHLVTPGLAVGFAAQVLLGAMSYLIPEVLGGGPTPVRAANEVLTRGGALRIALINAGLLVCLLPVPAIVRVLSSALVLAGLAAFLPLMFLAMRASRRAKAAPAPTTRWRGPDTPPRGRNVGHAALGLAAVVLAVAVGVALDPQALQVSARAASAGVVPTGKVTRVAVHAANMRFTPSTIEVPAGNRLVIDVTNTDRGGDVHDLVLDTGADSGRLAPGASATVDAGVVGRNVEGWCSVLGHRQMGMVLHVRVTGSAPRAPAAHDGGHVQGGMDMGASPAHPSAPSSPVSKDAADDLDFMAAPPAGFVAHDATLPPAPGGHLIRRTFRIQDVKTEVAPGVTQTLWTYNGTAPGPTLHGRVGDVFEITLVNDTAMGHSIDFHASAVDPQGPMRTLAPGESLVYRFRANRAGAWMYHCSSMPMSAHIANGLFGAVVIEPRGLPHVDRSYVLVQSELYLGPQGGSTDMDKIQAEKPDAVVFNGYVNQYDARPLVARAGERVRVWVVDAGPDRPTAFHVVGAQFDTTYAEGAYLLRRSPHSGSQALALAPSQGGFVELTFPEPGRYPFISHFMVDAERGAHGAFDVTH